MSLSGWDIVSFVAFLAAVVGISLYASRREHGPRDYFLAGGSLTWWLIGFSLIASNISTEHFVGMAGAGYGALGLAVASYEWIAAIALVVVALVLLPIYLRLGIYTMPEFLERRYGVRSRTLMAVYMMIAYVGVAMAAVLYSGALGLSAIFGLDMTTGIWLIGLLAGAYTIYGGLKAVVWSDLLQGGALLVGGLVVTVLGLREVGGLSEFLFHNAEKLHMILPADHPEIPWTAMLLGIWIPNFFYWGCNQFITQRALGARDLRAGQRGVLFAAAIKLVIPFIIVVPGMMALQLYAAEVGVGDEAYPVLIKHLLPAGLRGIMFAALFGAVMSSLDSMLNSASTIFTIDLYKRHIRPEASAARLVSVGRLTTGMLVVVACFLAPLPAKFDGVFTYIQLVWGFISPGVVAAFFFGLIVKRAPESAALWALVAGLPIYGLLLWRLPQVAFLNHMAITLVVLVIGMLLITARYPLATPVRFSAGGEGARTTVGIRAGATLIVLATAALYWVFW